MIGKARRESDFIQAADLESHFAGARYENLHQTEATNSQHSIRLAPWPGVVTHGAPSLRNENSVTYNPR